MDPLNQPPQSGLTPSSAPAPTRRNRIVGSLIALILVAGLGWLTWHLTRPAALGAGASAQRGGGGGGGPGGGGGGGPGGGGPGGGGAGLASTVGVGTAELADIPVIIDALGTVIPAATVTVRPQVGGVLKQILFKEGQNVKAGDVLGIIDPQPYEMALMQARGTRQRDEAQLESARVTLTRYQTLLGQDSIARQDVDTQAALVKQLEGTLLGDRAAEGTARINLGYTRIVAPVSGRVGLRLTDMGNVVSANDTTGLVVITQVAPIDVQFSVPQDQVPQVQQRAMSGAVLPVTALDRARAATLDSGKFSTLDNQVDTTTGTVRAKARFDNTRSTLFPNQFVNVQMLLRTISNAVVVPVTALRHGSAGDFVYVINMDTRTVSLRMVKRGQASVTKVEIVSGLKAGEKVVTEGADRLKDGAPVVLPGDKPRAQGPRGSAGANGERSGERGERGKGRARREAAAAATAPAAADGTAAPATAPASGAAGAASAPARPAPAAATPGNPARP